MADPILHIKDSYYFEVPKFLWPAKYTGLQGSGQFPDFWVRLDPAYLMWEAEQVYGALKTELGPTLPSWDSLRGEYEHWSHESHNHGKPFVEFVETRPWFVALAKEKSSVKSDLAQAQQVVRGRLNEYRQQAEWSDDKINGYNRVLSGHIIIPQPLGGEIKNLYEPASGFCVSKFMIVEVVVALLLGWFFISLAQRIQDGKTPKGRFWNFLEAILLFLRDEVARPAIGGHDADKFVPVLWTIFLFILGCNLMGMIPWVGTPTGSFGTTIALAMVTLATGVFSGSKKFGPIGFWANQVPHMDLPFVLKIVLVPAIWVLEVVGMFVRHGVLAVRLLANMVAGHLVLLSIMGIAFSAAGAASSAWWFTAPIVVAGSTLFSVMELFVAFLQAYIFTFLSALFIGAAVHHH